MTQTGLFKNRAPRVTDVDVAELSQLLDRQNWQSAHEVRLLLGWNLRTIRAVANASKGQIISGQQGYKLTLEASDDEVRVATRRLQHQAGEMQRRSIAILRVASERGGWVNFE